MRLQVHELVANSGVGSLLQWLQTNVHHQHLYAVRPKLYKAGSPAGSLTVKLLDESENVLATSDAVAISAITGNYFHGYVWFPLEYVLDKETKYGLLLQSSGYAFDEAAFIGWCTDFEHQKYARNYTPNSEAQCPLDVEMWTRKQRVKGYY